MQLIRGWWYEESSKFCSSPNWSMKNEYFVFPRFFFRDNVQRSRQQKNSEIQVKCQRPLSKNVGILFEILNHEIISKWEQLGRVTFENSRWTNESHERNNDMKFSGMYPVLIQFNR